MRVPANELARELNISGRTLRRAVRLGALRGTVPRSGVVLPVAERVYARRSWQLIAALRSALRTEPNVRFALLFGSAARGEDGDASDADLIVDLEDPSLERLADLAIKLGSAIDRPVDLARLSDASADPAFLADAIAEGRVLVDRDRQWGRLQARESSLRRTGEQQRAARLRVALDQIDSLLESSARR